MAAKVATFLEWLHQCFPGEVLLSAALPHGLLSLETVLDKKQKLVAFFGFSPSWRRDQTLSPSFLLMSLMKE